MCIWRDLYGYGVKSIQIFEKPFDRLMDDADEAFQNKYKAENYEDKRLKCMRCKSQINPHFYIIHWKIYVLRH